MRFERKSAQPLSEVLLQTIKSTHIRAGHNDMRIFEAWDEASGAAAYTLKRYFRGGKLYITVSSSVLRSHLSMQKEALKDRINQILETDPLFLKVESVTKYVDELIIK